MILASLNQVKVRNPQGRPKGNPNKVSEDLRQRILTFLSTNGVI